MKTYTPIKEGKVREVYDLGDCMMIEATDRISAFDVILGSVIPDKGRILTKMSEFWFDLTKDLVPNHMITTDNDEMPEFFRDEYHRGRTMKCRKLEMLPIECVVRGYISGSGWASYCENGTVSGIKLPEGLRESDKLPEPIFTPTTKAALGLHDEHVSFLKCVEILEKLYPEKGSLYAAEIRELTLKLYEKCSEYALSRGIIIADTKFEFGLDEKGKVVLGDEMITPDSSRLWPLDTYAPGGPEFSFDKQYVRDWLKENPDSGYVLPEDVIEKTSEKYREAYKLLTGKDFDTAEACHG
ncbi:MAG: phosphoribosylaminoimidazolesuccinocarboxamide synthase [Firmicutes bacterium]|nr:phosphoribosylaminoimidazolesuccinocarboxamide synthase [Bacillota bacterium]MBR3374873.1 phosphoribosylaminoimidazolesuccinocarboxamide synthase [Bacillota bacterium]MBR6955600.1 phosphoribosylaminoimidazolesuccinocarboxamide synthase [Bacillota bacterium]